jgi:hypothetical protein
MWPLTERQEKYGIRSRCTTPSALYIGCHDTDVRGSLVVVDTETGRKLNRLPIGGWVDSVFYDPAKSRIYASTGVGEVFTYKRLPDGSYEALEPVDTAVMAKTAFYSSELDRLFVAVPTLEEQRHVCSSSSQNRGISSQW